MTNDASAALTPAIFRPALKALVYGDVNLNIIDGSAIWAQSMCQVLSAVGIDTTLLLKAEVQTPRLVDPIAALPGVRVVRAVEEGLAKGPSIVPEAAVDLMAQLDDATPFDLVIVRGLRLATRAAELGRFDGRLWVYLTDIPQHVADIDGDVREQVGAIIASTRLVLCQTEDLRCFIEGEIPGAAGKCELWSPVVPPVEFEVPTPEPLEGRALKLGYVGKFAPHWNTLQMTELPALFAARGVSAEVHMVGDKIHDDSADPTYRARMTRALEVTPGVVWHGGVPRQEAMQAAAQMDIGLSWRDPIMDASLELSTKVLEFSALGVPVVLNRTPAHEDLFGADYPLFVDSTDSIVELVSIVLADANLIGLARERCGRVADRFGFPTAVATMNRLLAGVFPDASTISPALGSRPRPLRVGVASHDLKFFTRILDRLRSLREIEVRVDEWSALSVNDEQASQSLLEWADVVVAEWCGPVAVWYSQRKRADQRLIVRLHRFELDGPWLPDVAIDAIDAVVCVSPFYAELTRERTGWPADKVVVLPNWVDLGQFDRPKYEGAEFNLGMIGIAPARKRMDLGVEVLDRLRRRDARYHLYVKSKMPWDYWWIWQRPEEQEFYDDLFTRMERDDHLRGAVVFDGFGGDVPAWLRRIGWVLSTSDDESFHLAPAEGMASRAVPALLPWPGSDAIYSGRWIHADVDTMADAIDETVRGGSWEVSRQRAYAEVGASFPLDEVCDAWVRLIAGDGVPERWRSSLVPDMSD